MSGVANEAVTSAFETQMRDGTSALEITAQGLGALVVQDAVPVEDVPEKLRSQGEAAIKKVKPHGQAALQGALVAALHPEVPLYFAERLYQEVETTPVVAELVATEAIRLAKGAKESGDEKLQTRSRYALAMASRMSAAVWGVDEAGQYSPYSITNRQLRQVVDLIHWQADLGAVEDARITTEDIVPIIMHYEQDCGCDIKEPLSDHTKQKLTRYLEPNHPLVDLLIGSITRESIKSDALAGLRSRRQTDTTIS